MKMKPILGLDFTFVIIFYDNYTRFPPNFSFLYCIWTFYINHIILSSLFHYILITVFLYLIKFNTFKYFLINQRQNNKHYKIIICIICTVCLLFNNMYFFTISELGDELLYFFIKIMSQSNTTTNEILMVL